MYDAADLGYVPSDAQMVGYYVDGQYVPSAAALARFKHAVLVPIAVFPTTDRGIVFDGPPDNSTWPQVVDWVEMRRRAGVDPSVYTNADQWPVALAEFRARGVAPPHWWIAQWNERVELIPGAYAHQYHGSEHAGADISAVADYWPGVDPAPRPTPAPPAAAVTVEDDEIMMLLSVTPDPSSPQNTGAGLFLLSGPLLVHVTDTASLGALQAAGLKTAAVSRAQYDAIIAGSAALKGQLTGSLGVSGNLTVA